MGFYGTLKATSAAQSRKNQAFQHAHKGLG